MTLVECCKLAQDITRVPITILQTAVERAEFCSQHQFHPIQEYLLPHNIEFFLEGLSSNEIVSVTDLFQLKLLFFRVNSVPVAIGPFCTEFFSLNDCESLLRQLNLKNFFPATFWPIVDNFRSAQKPINGISYTACFTAWRCQFLKKFVKSIITPKISTPLFRMSNRTFLTQNLWNSAMGWKLP